MPLFGAICGLFQTGETKSLYNPPPFNPRCIQSKAVFVNKGAGGGSSGGGGGSSSGGGSKGGGSSGAGTSGGRGGNSSSNNTGGKTSSSTTAGKSVSATASVSVGAKTAATAKATPAAANTSWSSRVSGAVSSIGASLSAGYQSAKNAVSNTVSSVSASPVGKAVASSYANAKSTLSNAMSSLSSSPVGKAVASGYTSAKNALSSSLGPQSTVGKAVTGAYNSVSSALSNAYGKLTGSAPAGTTTGTVAKTQPATSSLSATIGRYANAIASRLGLSSSVPATGTTSTTTATKTSTTVTGFASKAIQDKFNSLMSALSSINPSTIGAGAMTRKQNGVSGLSPDAASAAIARKDEKRADAVNSTFVAAEKVTGVPAVIGEAIASRETHVAAPGVLTKSGMSPTASNAGYGMMQVDQKAHPGTALGAKGVTSLQHVEQAESIFNQGLNKVETQHPTWSQGQDLQAAIDRYNGGRSSNTANLDKGSTGGDYGGDVAARAQTYAKDGLGN